MRAKKALLFFISLLCIFFLVFRIHTEAYTNVYSFDPMSGGNTPYDSLTLVGDVFYGVTNQGGTSSAGVLFEYDPAHSSYREKYQFDGTTGKYPVGDLLNVGGVLYGMTKEGGANDRGVLFKFDTLEGSYTVLVDFNETNGASPFSSLFGNAGVFSTRLYGTTRLGGASNLGTVFVYDTSNNTLTTLFSFGSSGTGEYPETALVMGPTQDILYGTTSGGGVGSGVLYSITPTSETTADYAEIGSFGDAISGTTPGELFGVPAIGGVTYQSSDIVAYGVTTGGGANAVGTLFSVSLGGTMSVIHDFNGAQGASPHGAVVKDGDYLYGTTTGGGQNSGGTIYAYNLLDSTFFYIESLSGSTAPYGSVVPDGNGTFYSTGSSGGDNNAGLIFSFSTPDFEPDVFTFSSASNKPISTDITSESVTLSGFTVPLPIRIENCTSTCSYSGGTDDGYVNAGDQVSITVRSAGACENNTSGTLYIGDTHSAVFTVTTQACGGGEDTTAPTLSEVTPVQTPASDTTPNYTFTTDEAGTILYSGDCSSGTTSASVGSNTISFDTLSEGTHSNCSIRVRDSANNTSTSLQVSTFVIDLTAPTVSFSIPATGTSLTVPVTFSAADTVGVTGYLLTTTSGTPVAASVSNGSAPSSYTFGSYGSKTLYAWARDGAGNVSSGHSATIVLTDQTQQENDNTNNTNSPGGGGSVSGSIKEFKLTPPPAPTEATDLPTEDSVSKKVAKVLTPPTITVLDSPVKQAIRRNFTPAQVQVIEFSIEAIIATVTAIGSAIILASVLFLNPLARPEFILIPIRLWGMLLVLLGLRKKPVPWGTVYDSVTKQPLDPVRVSLIDTEGNVVETSITDSSGRYGFAAEPGLYKVVLSKTNYIFPSHVIAQNDMRDELYDKPYFGDYLPYDPAAPITKNIPLDPLDFDSALFAQKQGDLSIHYSKREAIADRVFNTMFLTTFLIVALSIIVYPEKYNVIICALYAGAFILRRHNKRLKHMGRMYDLYGKPLAHVLIKVYSAVDNTLIKTIKTNRAGRYYLHVPQGLYTIRVERKTTDGLYVPVYSSPELMIQHGTLNKVFNIAYS